LDAKLALDKFGSDFCYLNDNKQNLKDKDMGWVI
jgi:hypothetical protein